MAQSVMRIPDDVACASCEIRVEPVAALNSSDRAVLRSLPDPSVTRDGKGRFIVAPVLGDGVLGVYGQSGNLLSLYGKEGGGPTEFGAPVLSKLLRIGSDDLLHVFDGFHVHRIDVSDFRHIDKRKLDMPARDAVVVGTTPLVQWPVLAPGAQGTPIQVLGEDGRIVTGIGSSTDRPISRSRELELRRVLSRTADQRGVWSSYLNRYEISRFDLSGEEEIKVVRDSNWFKPYDTVLPGEGLLVPSRPRIRGLLDAGSHILWVAIVHADVDFAPLAQSGPGQEVPVDPYIDLNRFFDTTVEVIDVQRGRLLARRRFDEYLQFVDTADNDVLIYFLRTTATGENAVHVYRADISTGPEK